MVERNSSLNLRFHALVLRCDRLTELCKADIPISIEIESIKESVYVIVGCSDPEEVEAIHDLVGRQDSKAGSVEETEDGQRNEVVALRCSELCLSKVGSAKLARIGCNGVLL